MDRPQGLSGGGWAVRDCASAGEPVAGAGFWQLDLGLLREFKLKEAARLVFRAEAFNSLNHTNFSMPAQDVSSPAFGQISVVYDPRIFQFSLQLRF